MGAQVIASMLISKTNKSLLQRCTNSVALGVGVALAYGGGLMYLGTAFWIIYLGALPKGRNYALAFSGLLAVGWHSGSALDQGHEPLTALLVSFGPASVAVIAGFLSWHFSQQLIERFAPDLAKAKLYMLMGGYIVAYLVSTVLLTALLGDIK